MSSNGPPDAWDALRDRLDRRSFRSRRPGWVPSGSQRGPRSSPASPDDADASETPTRQSPRLDRAHVVVAALVTAVALLGTFVVLGNAQPVEQVVPVAAPQPTVEADMAPDAGTTTGAGTAPEAAPGHDPWGEVAGPTPSVSRLVVHVVGDVAEPGVVRLEPGSRVIDAVEAAGGSLPGADLSTVNLARLVADGEQVRVGLPPDDSVSGAVADADQASGVVNVNQAGVDLLVELPGIGPVLADRIVAYRESNGPFLSVDQMLEVPGIGPSILETIHDRVRL